MCLSCDSVLLPATGDFTSRVVVQQVTVFHRRRDVRLPAQLLPKRKESVSLLNVQAITPQVRRWIPLQWLYAIKGSFLCWSLQTLDEALLLSRWLER